MREGEEVKRKIKLNDKDNCHLLWDNFFSRIDGSRLSTHLIPKTFAPTSLDRVFIALVSLRARGIR